VNTYVAEIDGEAILVFRAEDDDAARRIISEKDGGFQIAVLGYSGLLRADGRVIWNGTSPIRYRRASPHEHKQWLAVRNSRSKSTDDPNDWIVYLVSVISIDDMN
jgi:hypothetical protein